MEHSNKISIICIHKDIAILRDRILPMSVNDSGKLYACEKCWKNLDSNIKNGSMDKWTSICEGCIHDMLEARMKNIII